MFTKADTLNDILGWEENTVYYYKHNSYKILNNKLFFYSRNEDKWELSILQLNELISLRDNAIRHKRYYYKLKKEYNLPNNNSDNLYLNYNTLEYVISLDNCIETKTSKTKFTEEQYISLMNTKELNTEMFERVEI